MHFVTSDGNRVAKNGVIANIYDSESASITVTEIENVKNKIADIKDILSYNDIDAANLDLINSRVTERVNELVLSVSTGNFSGVSASADKLLSAINRRQAAMGNTGDFSAQLELLNTQLTTLSSSLPSPTGKILATESGYFVSMTDGYEQVLTCQDLSLLTPEYLESASAKNYESSVVGKIVSDYEWYIAAQMSISESLNYKEGQSLKIITSVKSSPELAVTVKKINISETSGEAVVLFACNEMNSELAAMRSGPMTVVKAEYNGLKVDRKALRVVESQKGVYVLSGMQISFVPVDILYSNESYIICDKKNENNNVLKLYDSVVVKGKNLYDGKIIS
ncbi:MAG: hypothetical protein IKB45_02215 [Clostridia bacterium]|nr:hypothetical protein [Clostridia bacterium]